MSSLGLLFKAERVKWRKSWPLVTAILAPVSQVVFLAVLFWFSEGRFQPFKPVFRFWLELNYIAWNLVLMPVMAALICALSWEQEREAKSWNLLLIQPVPRHAHYLVKLASHLCLLLISQIVLALLLPLAGFLLCRNPGLLMGTFQPGLLLRFAGYSIVALPAVVVFQTWLSMRIPGLWSVLLAAMVGGWAAHHWAGGSPFVSLLPWGMASHMDLVFDRRLALPWGFGYGSLCSAAVLAVLGTLDFKAGRNAIPRS